MVDLGGSVLLHPPYSADFAPSDFHPFHSLQNDLNDQKFSQENQVKTFVENLLSWKTIEFYLSGINKLPDEWQEVIKNDGKYTID